MQMNQKLKICSPTKPLVGSFVQRLLDRFLLPTYPAVLFFSYMELILSLSISKFKHKIPHMCYLKTYIHARCGCVHHENIASHCAKLELKDDGILRCWGTITNERISYNGRPLCKICHLKKSIAIYKYFDKKEKELSREIELGIRGSTAARVMMQYYRDGREDCIRRLDWV